MRPILKKAAANALFIAEWLTGNPSVQMIVSIEYMKRMMTHVRRIARCMLFVDHEPAAKDIKMIYIYELIKIE